MHVYNASWSHPTLPLLHRPTSQHISFPTSCLFLSLRNYWVLPMCQRATPSLVHISHLPKPSSESKVTAPLAAIISCKELLRQEWGHGSITTLSVGITNCLVAMQCCLDLGLLDAWPYLPLEVGGEMAQNQWQRFWEQVRNSAASSSEHHCKPL